MRRAFCFKKVLRGFHFDRMTSSVPGVSGNGGGGLYGRPLHRHGIHA